MYTSYPYQQYKVNLSKLPTITPYNTRIGRTFGTRVRVSQIGTEQDGSILIIIIYPMQTAAIDWHPDILLTNKIPS